MYMFNLAAKTEIWDGKLRSETEAHYIAVLALNSPSSCLRPLSTGIAHIQHRAWFSRR